MISSLRAIIVGALVTVMIVTILGIVVVAVYQPPDTPMIITHIIGFGGLMATGLMTFLRSLANSEQITRVGAQLSGQDEREQAREEEG